MTDRPDRLTSAAVEKALELPRAHAAMQMKQAGVPLAVIGRVLDKRGRRRITNPLLSAAAGQQSPPEAGTPK